jgi:hypothetical protein
MVDRATSVAKTRMTRGPSSGIGPGPPAMLRAQGIASLRRATVGTPFGALPWPEARRPVFWRTTV